MSRTARRQAQARALSAHPVDLTDPHNPDCPVASKVAVLVDALDQRWMVDPRPCERCGTTTTVAHDAEGVWVCLLCGQHGSLAPGGAVRSEAVLH